MRDVRCQFGAAVSICSPGRVVQVDMNEAGLRDVFIGATTTTTTTTCGQPTGCRFSRTKKEERKSAKKKLKRS